MSLTLTDIEDFIPVLPLAQAKYSIDSETFVEEQYKRFLDATTDDAINQYVVHKQLRSFRDLLSRNEASAADTSEEATSSPIAKQKLFLRRNFLFNLVYHKYAFDMQSIQNQSIYNNYYFNPKENNLAKQLFIAFIQIALTALLLTQTVAGVLDGEMEWDNHLNVVCSVFITYLTAFLIEPQMTSIWDDFLILKRYFRMRASNVAVNFISNVVLALLIPLITFFVIMTSETVMDIVLNATAISFIIELDDIISNEVDAENWFVNTSSAAIVRLFKETVAFNDDCVVDDQTSGAAIDYKVHQIREQVQAFNDVALSWTWQERLGNLLKLVAAPIYMWRFPFVIALSCFIARKKELSRRETRESDKRGNADETELLSGTGTHKQGGGAYGTLDDHDDDDDAAAGGARVTEANETKEVDESIADLKQMAKGIRWNNKGNEEIAQYKFDAACSSYDHALLLLMPTRGKRESESLFVVSYNAANAFYERGKRSFTSEIVTCCNGHPFTNYNRARQYALEAIMFYATYCRLNDGEPNDECLFLRCNIFIGLYNFDDASRTISKCDDRGLAHKKLTQQITNAKKLLSGLPNAFLKDVDDLRCNIARMTTQTLMMGDGGLYSEFYRAQSGTDHADIALSSLLSDEMIQAVNEIIDNGGQWFEEKENAFLKGKLFYMRSEYFLAKKDLLLALENGSRRREEQKDEKEEKFDVEEYNNLVASIESKVEECVTKARGDALKAKKCSDLYGWVLFNLPAQDDGKDTGDGGVQLCTDIINAYTTQIEFDGKQPYYYYVRGRAYYKLFLMKSTAQSEDNHVVDVDPDLQRAAQDFKRAIDLDPEQDVFLIRFGLCQYQQNEKDAASETFKQAQRLGAGLKRTISLNEIAGLMAAYFDASLRDNDEGMNQNEYRRFMGMLNPKSRAQFQTLGTFDQIAGDDGVIDPMEVRRLIEHIVDKPEDYAYWTDHLKAWEVRFNQTKHGDDEVAKKFIQWRKEKADLFIAEYKRHLSDMVYTMIDAVEFDDDKEGLTKHEYKRVVGMMPDFENMRSYFDKLRFEAYAGCDGIMTLDDMRNMVDTFIEQSV